MDEGLWLVCFVFYDCVGCFSFCVFVKLFFVGEVVSSVVFKYFVIEVLYGNFGVLELDGGKRDVVVGEGSRMVGF